MQEIAQILPSRDVEDQRTRRRSGHGLVDLSPHGKSPGNENGPDDLVAAWFLSVPRSALWGSAAVATAVWLRSMAEMQPGGGGSLGNWFGSRIDGHTR